MIIVYGDDQLELRGKAPSEAPKSSPVAVRIERFGGLEIDHQLVLGRPLRPGIQSIRSRAVPLAHEDRLQVVPVPPEGLKPPDTVGEVQKAYPFHRKGTLMPARKLTRQDLRDAVTAMR
jgi:hypothetical protein